MINLKTWLVSVVTSDPTLQTILQNNASTATVSYNIYPAGVPIQPEAFPAITYMDAGMTLLSVPTGMHTGNFQVDIYSLLNSLETETIYARLAQLINYKHNSVLSSPFPDNGILWWAKETMVKDSVEGAERRMWRKTINYKVWVSNQDLS